MAITGVGTRSGAGLPGAGGHREDEDPPVVRGRGLRFLLVDELRRRQRMTVAEMVAFLGHTGFTVAGRPSKVISDALRWEVGRGRVARAGRGLYHYRGAPVSTARRIRLFANRCHTWLLAYRLGQAPPPAPANRRPAGVEPPEGLPGVPPWHDLRWLWTR